MSKLQEFMGKIVQIIVSYNETQTTKNYPSESFAKKSPEELHEFLQKVIIEATSIYETRRSLLEYFLFVVDTIKPLTDQKKSLTQPEQQIIKDTLSSFMNTIKKLLKTSHSSYINLKYSGSSIIQVPGFMRGALRAYSLCNTGQVISQELSESLEQEPFADYLQKLIIEHQLPLLEIERLAKAKTDETNEKELMQEKINSLSKQIEQQKQEIERLQIENKDFASKIETIKTEAELKEKQPRPEVTENIELRQKLQELTIKLSSSLEKNLEYSNEINGLKTEICSLQELQKSRSADFLDNWHRNGFFTYIPVEDNSEPKTITNNNYNESRSNYSSINGKTCTE